MTFSSIFSYSILSYTKKEESILSKNWCVVFKYPLFLNFFLFYPKAFEKIYWEFSILNSQKYQIDRSWLHPITRIPWPSMVTRTAVATFWDTQSSPPPTICHTRRSATPTVHLTKHGTIWATTKRVRIIVEKGERFGYLIFFLAYS